jgi:hypothetical protein
MIGSTARPGAFLTQVRGLCLVFHEVYAEINAAHVDLVRRVVALLPTVTFVWEKVWKRPIGLGTKFHTVPWLGLRENIDAGSIPHRCNPTAPYLPGMRVTIAGVEWVLPPQACVRSNPPLGESTTKSESLVTPRLSISFRGMVLSMAGLTR